MVLEFEKPIADLEQKLQEMKDLARGRNIDLSKDINSLEGKILALKKETFANLTRWQRVQLSRHADRPYALDYIYESYRKALRLMKMAEKFGKPIITLIDTPGAFPGIEAEERGQGEAIARNIKEMFTLKVPVICIIIGEGASGGALGIAIGDRVFMLENTWYSVISPESCSSILWRSWDYKEQAAEALKLTSTDMKSNGLVDDIIPEPLGGAHKDIKEMSKTIKKAILQALKTLDKQSPEERISQRIDKFCAMGVVVE